jgi:hypothetical protein
MRWSSTAVDFAPALTAHQKQRPIIFVGHSLGGLVIKQVRPMLSNRQHTHRSDQALIRANEKYNSGQDRARGAVHPNTAGVVFMGTPHRGSAMSSIGEIVQGVARLAFRQPNKHILRTLSEESDVLEQQRQSFATISQGFPIACIFEELPVAAGMVSAHYIHTHEASKEIAGSPRVVSLHGWFQSQQD